MERCERSSAGARLREGERLKSCVYGRPVGQRDRGGASGPIWRRPRTQECLMQECGSSRTVLHRATSEAQHWSPAEGCHTLATSMVQHWTLALRCRRAAVADLAVARAPECQSSRVSVGVGESGRHLDGVTQDGTMALF